MAVRTPARVAVIFGPGGQIRPVWFELNHRKYEIRETTYHWRHRSGDSLLLHYAVSDGINLYELIYNSRDQSWTLTEPEGG